jgi:hypothetical protein
MDDLGIGLGEDGGQGGGEIGVGGVVGPEGEDAAGMKLGGEGAEAGRLVEWGVAGMEEVAGGVIDVEEDGVEEAGRVQRVEALAGCEGEKVGMDEAATGV